MKEQHEYGRQTIGRRIAAFLADAIIITLLAMTPFLIPTNFVGLDAFAPRLPLILAIGIGGLLLKDAFGRSIGKLLLGVTISHNDEPDRRVSAIQRILRNLPLLIWPVELIVMLSDSDARRFGDRWAHTHAAVITKQKKAVVALVMVSAFVALLLAIVLFITHSIRNDSSYKTAVAYIQSEADIVLEVGGIEGFGTFPSGKVQYENGYGYARLKIPVIGHDDTITVLINLSKAPDGDWEVQEYGW